MQDNTPDLVMDFYIVDEVGEEGEMDSQAIYKMRQLIPSSSKINCKFHHEEHLDDMQDIGVVEKLISRRASCGGGTPFYSQCYEFQQSTTDICRGRPHITLLLLTPVSHEYETINILSMKVVLSLLLMYGILKMKEVNITKRMKLEDGHKN